MLRFAKTLSHSSSESEDILQTSLMKALKAFPSFLSSHFLIQDPTDAEKNFEIKGSRLYLKNWLFKIVKNTYLDQQHRKKRWVSDLSDAAIEKKLGPAPISLAFVPALGPAHLRLASTMPYLVEESREAFYDQALDDDWKKKLDILSDKQRTILFLIAEDYSYKEVSSILGIPMGTVMSNLSRALQKLRSPHTGLNGEPKVAGE